MGKAWAGWKCARFTSRCVGIGGKERRESILVEVVKVEKFKL